MCKEVEAEKFAALMLRLTTTLGVRQADMKRYTLSRSQREEDTPFGKVRVKVSEGYGVCKEKPEMEDLIRIAREKGLSTLEVRKLVE